MQKPVNSETNLIKAIWNRTNLNEQSGRGSALKGALKAAESIFAKETAEATAKAAAKAAEKEAAEAAAKAGEADLFSGIVGKGIATPTLTTAAGKIYSPKPPKTTSEVMRDAAGLGLTKTGTRRAKQSIPLDPKQQMASDPFNPNASTEPFSAINNTPRDLRTAAEIAGAVDNSGIKVTVGGDRMSPISYPGTMYKFDPNWKNNLRNLGRAQPSQNPLAVGPGQGKAVPVIKTQEPINSHNTLATGKERTSTGGTNQTDGGGQYRTPTPDPIKNPNGDGPGPRPIKDPDPVIKGIEGTKMPGSTTPKPKGNLLRTVAEIGVLAAGAAKLAGVPAGTQGTPYVPYSPSQDDNNSRTAGTAGTAGGAGSPGGAGTAGKQYYYPDTFVGREIGTETSASRKKQTVDQQLASTAKQITDRSGTQKAATTAAPARVTPVQITEPGIPAGQLNQPHVQRPATNQEDLKRVRWNSASYHQLSAQEKKFVEDNDRAQGFDKMPGGQYHTENQMESYTPEKQEIIEHYRQLLAQKLTEQQHWGMDKVRDAVAKGVIDASSYAPGREGVVDMHSALEGGTISVPPVGGDSGKRKDVTNYTQAMDRVFIGQKIFPDNRSAQASLHMVMRSMGSLHGSHPTGFHPALEGIVPHDPNTHGALNQLVPSTIAHTENLRKAWKLQYP
jgi:hypothetical protein